MKKTIRTMALLFGISFIVSACADQQSDHVGPVIRDISTSGKVVVISDCADTSVTITAKVTDVSNITNVLLWYRVGSDQPFASLNMNPQSGLYTVAVKGSDFQGHGYGAMEFYITAENASGNTSKSPLDNSIQFLPCVSN